MLTVDFRRLRLKAGQILLDLGCGEGRHTLAAARIAPVHAIGLDADAPSLAAAREKARCDQDPIGVAHFLRGDAYSLPFADGALDVVICSEVLEHLADYRAVIAEIHRVLAPGGALAVTVPNAWPEALCWALAPGEGGYADQPGGHVRIFWGDGLRTEIAEAGFIFDHRSYAHGLHAPYWWLKTALWRRRETHPLVKAFHRFLVWDMMERPLLTRVLESLLNPIMGKSVAYYFRKSA